MKVLFINENDFNSQPLGIMTLSSVLKQRGVAVDYLDLKFERDYLQEVKKIAPDIIAYSVVTFTWKFYQQINLTIKKHYDFFALFGGIHCTIYPEIINEEGVDAICRGEGEQPFTELVEALQNGQDYTGIKNLWVKRDGVIYKNDIRELVADLDSLPYPDQEILRKYSFNRNIGIYYVITSKGCPYVCSYCINHYLRKLYQGKGNYVRKRSVKNVIDELIILKQQYGAKIFYFSDDIFTLDKLWLEAFAVEYREKVGLPFDALTRVDTIDEQTIKTLKYMGCSTACIGIESGDEELRSLVLKRNISDEVIINISRLFKDNGITTMSFNMLCLPDETVEKAFKTLRINTSGKVTYPMTFIFQPLPNNDLTKYAIEKGYYNGDLDHYQKSLVDGKSLLVSRDVKELGRLRYLFILGAKFPFLQQAIRWLIRLPLDPLYRLLFFLSRSYIIVFKIYRPSVGPIMLYHLKRPFVRFFPDIYK